jgi:hypothetical protein
MKSEIQAVPEAEFMRLFPLAGPVADWRLALEEISMGVYECRGGDRWGRRVSRKGTNPDALLQQCSRDISEIVTTQEAGT